MDTLERLQIVYNHLSSKLVQLKTELLLQEKLQKQEPTTLSHCELSKAITTQENELKDAINASINEENVNKMLTCGQECFTAVHHRELDLELDEQTEKHYDSCGEKLKQVAELSTEIASKVKKLESLQRRNMHLQKKLEEIQLKNQDLSVLVSSSESMDDSIQQSKDDHQGKKSTELQKELEKVMKECALRKSCLQMLIQASAVDWFADPELLELVTSLGEPTQL